MEVGARGKRMTTDLAGYFSSKFTLLTDLLNVVLINHDSKNNYKIKRNLNSHTHTLHSSAGVERLFAVPHYRQFCLNCCVIC
jgi:hypothetical protein